MLIYNIYNIFIIKYLDVSGVDQFQKYREIASSPSKFMQSKQNNYWIQDRIAQSI
jgi:hypothetical protein